MHSVRQKTQYIKLITEAAGEKEDNNEVRNFIILSQEICFIKSQIGRRSKLRE